MRHIAPLLLLLALGCPPPGDPVEVRIPPGLTTAAIADTLHAHGVIGNPTGFRLLARLSGYDRRLQHGHYRLRRNSPLPVVLNQLSTRGRTSVTVTIPEGWRLLQIAGALAEAGVCGREEFVAACQDRVLLAGLGIPNRSAEGWLFPDTYEFELDSEPSRVVTRMAGKFAEVYAELVKEAAPRLDDRETVILASIVEREGVVPAELPVIAGVFLNRLARALPLQSCATVLYALPEYKEQLSLEDVHYPSPYNTYLRPGLPPGPISNPGRTALRAAIRPARHDFLYFVANGDGTHTFSRTLREHEQAQRRLRRS